MSFLSTKVVKSDSLKYFEQKEVERFSGYRELMNPSRNRMPTEWHEDNKQNFTVLGSCFLLRIKTPCSIAYTKDDKFKFLPRLEDLFFVLQKKAKLTLDSLGT
ncbi:hypothetical protein ACOSQ4_032627 [Xanthoceras sorbifolium]